MGRDDCDLGGDVGGRLPAAPPPARERDACGEVERDAEAEVPLEGLDDDPIRLSLSVACGQRGATERRYWREV